MPRGQYLHPCGSLPYEGKELEDRRGSVPALSAALRSCPNLRKRCRALFSHSQHKVIGHSSAHALGQKVQPVLPPEAFTVHDERGRAEHLRLHRAPGVVEVLPLDLGLRGHADRARPSWPQSVASRSRKDQSAMS